MVLIEGFGDEVLQFFGIIFVVLLLTIAWQSTKVRGANVNINLLLLWLHMRLQVHRLSGRVILARRNLENDTEEEQSNRNNTLEQTSEMGEESTNPSTDEGIVFGNDNGRVTLPKQNSNNPNIPDPQNERNTLDSSQNQNSNVVCIKFKFSNASVKTIHVNLNERLGDFKRKIFNIELSEGRTVLLIFKGKILNKDRDTLKACGLFSNCVVHCLIREPAFVRPQTQIVESRQFTSRENPSEEVQGNRRVYTDFGFAMLTILLMLGMLLIISWYTRYRYKELFSLSATAGLMILTGLFIAFVVSSFLPEGEVNQFLSQ